jgi:hypothetical protein
MIIKLACAIKIQDSEGQVSDMRRIMIVPSAVA